MGDCRSWAYNSLKAEKSKSLFIHGISRRIVQNNIIGDWVTIGNLFTCWVIDLKWMTVIVHNLAARHTHKPFFLYINFQTKNFPPRNIMQWFPFQCKFHSYITMWTKTSKPISNKDILYCTTEKYSHHLVIPSSGV